MPFLFKEDVKYVLNVNGFLERQYDSYISYINNINVLIKDIYMSSLQLKILFTCFRSSKA